MADSRIQVTPDGDVLVRLRMWSDNGSLRGFRRDDADVPVRSIRRSADLGPVESSRRRSRSVPRFGTRTSAIVRGRPVDPDCAVCESTTDREVRVLIVCERPETKGQVRYWEIIVLWFLSIWLLLYRVFSAREQQHGRNVAFLVPVRVCESCARSFTSSRAIRDGLSRAQVYAQLFGKYPHATVRRSD